MSGKEIAVNTLLGLLLLSIFAILFAALAGAAGLAFYSVDVAVKRFLPGVVRSSDLSFFVVFSLLSVVCGVGHLRKRNWTSGLLSFAVIAIPLASLRAGTIWRGSPWSSTYPLFLLVLIALDRRLRTWESTLAGSFLVAGVVLNAGLLGTGSAANVVADCAYVGLFVWVLVKWRRGELGGRTLNDLHQTNL